MAQHVHLTVERTGGDRQQQREAERVRAEKRDHQAKLAAKKRKAEAKSAAKRVTHASVQPIRRCRHWKQQWEPGHRFVFRRRTEWPRFEVRKGERKLVEVHVFEAGAVVPDWVVADMGGAKLRRWWESHRIELYQFEKDPLTRPTTIAYDVPPQGAPRSGPKSAAKKPKKARRQARPGFERKPKAAEKVRDDGPRKRAAKKPRKRKKKAAAPAEPATDAQSSGSSPQTSAAAETAKEAAE